MNDLICLIFPLLGSKKHVKKDHRKSPATLADSLGPALFSTPDIIRRVSVGSESKPSETSPSTPTTPVTSNITTSTTPQLNPLSMQSTSVKSGEPMHPKIIQAIPPKTIQSIYMKSITPVQSTTPAKLISEPSTLSLASNSVLKEPKFDLSTMSQPLEEPMDVDSEDQSIQKDQKTEIKAPFDEELQPSLDAGEFLFLYFIIRIACYV